MTKSKIENIAESLDWAVDWNIYDDYKCVEFSKYSP